MLGAKEGQLVELMDNQSPSPEASPRCKKEQEK